MPPPSQQGWWDDNVERERATGRMRVPTFVHGGTRLGGGENGRPTSRAATFPHALHSVQARGMGYTLACAPSHPHLLRLHTPTPPLPIEAGMQEGEARPMCASGSRTVRDLE